MKYMSMGFVGALFTLLPASAGAAGLSVNVGGAVDTNANLGTQVEVVPYLKPVPMLAAELGYRYNVNAAVPHTIVPGFHFGVPMVGRLRAGLPVGLSTDLPVSFFVGVQRDILPLPFAKLYVEVDIETDINRTMYGGIFRIGGKFGL